MSRKRVHWVVATGVALGLHAMVLEMLFRDRPPRIEVAGQSIEVSFGNAGNSSTNTNARSGIDTESESAPEPEPTSVEEQSPVREPEPEPEPEDEAEPDPEVEHEPELAPEPDIPATAEMEQSADTQTDASEMTQGEAVQTGEEAATTTSSGAPTADSKAQTTNSQAGNAAASNYGGKIVAMLNRKRLPASVRVGSAKVTFHIDPDGSVRDIKIIESSGSSRFDRAVIRIVERAAPFPEPPPGATVDYAVVIDKD
ncbi:MAG: TonB family protein [Pseudomonadota bacterium]